jgi:hypothetical protein
MLLLQENPVGDLLNNTEWAFPLAECFHIVGFGIAIGTVVLVDLRLMGLALKQQAASYLVKQTWMWTLFALVISIFAGIAIFLTDPIMYERNASFRFKLTALAVAILYNYTIHHKVAMSGSSGVFAKLVGGVSIALWLSVVASGLFIAFV